MITVLNNIRKAATVLYENIFRPRTRKLILTSHTMTSPGIRNHTSHLFPKHIGFRRNLCMHSTPYVFTYYAVPKLIPLKVCRITHSIIYYPSRINSEFDGYLITFVPRVEEINLTRYFGKSKLCLVFHIGFA